MSRLFTFLGIGVGGYLLYQSGILATLTGGLIPDPQPAALPPAATPPAGTNLVPAGPDTRAMVLAAAGGGDPLMSFDQWNSYYASVRGIPGPNPDEYLTTATRLQKISVAEWWGYMQRAGLSGMRGSLGYYTAMQYATPQDPQSPIPGGFYPRAGLGRWI